MKSKTLPVISTYLHRLIHPKPCHPPTTRWNYSSKFCLTLLQAHVHSIFIFHILKLRVLISSCVSLLQLTIKLYKFTWPQIRFYIPQVKMEIPNITKVNPYIHTQLNLYIFLSMSYWKGNCCCYHLFCEFLPSIILLGLERWP